MNLKDWLIPDEIQSGTNATLNMFRTVSRTSNFWKKQLFAAAVPFLIGGGASFLLVPDVSALQDKSQLKDVITNVMTFSSVLAGFIVTLMLFTGRTEGANSLDVDQANNYISKVKYLIFSQIVTLLVYLACIFSCLWWLIVFGLQLKSCYLSMSWHSTAGLLLLSIFRTVLLPLQIYEVHDFELQTLHDEKYAEYQKSLQDFLKDK
ncbi:hypothetical protein [Pseudomonas kuykendallii]|uniref:hypothetical protein n=1 Tax=Pseudomonas kuykendallii TaxID=1007099 RepID=UPI002354D8CD|nr:hypothetical protein [Pseudomonas kuykendallii]